MDRIERIKHMEQLFDKACTVIYNDNKSAASVADIQPVIKELAEYCDSGVWLADYQADEQNQLPEDLKRGVLSQDGLYNLLIDNDTALNELTGDAKNMKKLLYIDSCIRDAESRTKQIAQPIIEKLKQRYEVETIVLNDLDLAVIQKDECTRRASGIVSPEAVNWACKIRDADRIVIAAPFWDMSIPAALKTFFELCSLPDITFCSNDTTCYGNCRCEDLLFITTRGMNIKTGDELEQATSYLKALSWLWGLKGLKVIARENFDYIPEEQVKEQIADAIEEGLKIAETF